MATDYFQSYGSGDYQALPTPSDTPYETPFETPIHTPRHPSSRRSSRHGIPSPMPSSSPPPLPPDNTRRSDDIANDESIPITDPRRFTPTLHANLVAEILNLRRELDSKHHLIADLETNLHDEKKEKEAVQQELKDSNKSTRDLRKHIKEVEAGVVTTLEEIVKDRDQLNASNGDLKAKLEVAHLQLRSQEDEAIKAHDMFESERQTWTGEKQALQRRVDITDKRLKLVLDEFDAQREAHEHANQSEGEDNTHDSGFGNESDGGSVHSSPVRRASSRTSRHARNMSNSSFRSISRLHRFSVTSGAGSEGHAGLNGATLADELRFDEEEEDLAELELDSDDYPENEMRARRALESRQSMYQDDKAKKILGIGAENKDHLKDLTEEEGPKSFESNTVRGDAVFTPVDRTLNYVDTGVQFTPPSSPKMAPSSPPKRIDLVRTPSLSEVTEIEANQRRKRVSVQSLVNSFSQQQQPPALAKSALMVSTSAQTIEQPVQPLSPPETPKISTPPATAALAVAEVKPETASASTQTDNAEAPPTRKPPPIPIPVPSISIHPPADTPDSPGEAVLPPGTKSISSQTDLSLAASVKEASVQTEEIRIDQRLHKLPPHLLPSKFTSQKPEEKKRELSVLEELRSNFEASKTAVPAKPVRAPPPPPSASGSNVEDRYPGRNDNGPLGRDSKESLRRPFRTSSLFAGFDGPSSDEEEGDAVDISDEESAPLRTAPAMAGKLRNMRPFANPPTPISEEKESPASSHANSNRTSAVSGRTSLEKMPRITKSGSLSKQASFRRSTLIQNGVAAHSSQRSRSPSLGSIGSSTFSYSSSMTRPPIPIPSRSSSRKPFTSKSEGSQSPTPTSAGSFPGRRGPPKSRHQRVDSLRKVRSAAVIPRHGRPRSRSPPLPSTPPRILGPAMPPAPLDPTSPSVWQALQQTGPKPPLATSHTGTGSIASSSQQNSVVDSIAAAMVGEWMWKYVRKRTTFGSADKEDGDNNTAVPTVTGVRHKRWVWVSPYERTVMWSNKQPASGTALMGKAGRKLTISSVLDVPDDNPVPKGVFRRSILILTPARALKFTAVTRERHYMWLTALSFLAHSSQGGSDLNTTTLPPPPPSTAEAPPHSQASLRRAPIRDSVRIAKDKAKPMSPRPATSRNHTVPFESSFSESQFGRPVPECADAPIVPKYHSRKRSSTGPRIPPAPATLRSFSHRQLPSTYSGYSGSSDLYSPALPSGPSSVSGGYNPVSAPLSGRTSEASSSARFNFFEAVGTVRMEAFIEPTLRISEDGNGLYAGKRPTGRRRGNSQWSGSSDNPHCVGGVFEDFDYQAADPFRGF